MNNTRQTPLVRIDKLNSGARYSRFVGKNLTHSVEADSPLSPGDVELFRTEPEKLLSEAVVD